MRGRTQRAGAALAVVLASVVATTATSASDAVFTVGNYPVEARAADAMSAKTQALAEGQQRAFRSLLKRLVPVTAYGQLKKFRNAKVANFVDGFQVRSERNSSTEYIASMDFKFQPQAIRDLLDREGLPYADEQAGEIIVVPVWLGAPNPAIGSEKSWNDAWKGLDLKYALTPVNLQPLKKEVVADVVKGMVRDGQGQRILAGEYKSDRVVLAVAEHDPQTKRLNVTLTGVDAVGNLMLKRAYRLDPSDAGYTVEVAAVVGMGVLEGRWKALKARGGKGGGANTAAGRQGFNQGGGNLEISVEFRGMGEWRDISRKLAATPGIEDLDVAGMSGRGARVTMSYPDGPQRLADVLAGEGLILKRAGAGWVLTQQQ